MSKKKIKPEKLHSELKQMKADAERLVANERKREARRRTRKWQVGQTVAVRRDKAAYVGAATATITGIAQEGTADYFPILDVEFAFGPKGATEKRTLSHKFFTQEKI